MLAKRTTRTKKKAMMDTINWFCDNDQSFDEVDDKTLEVFTEVTGTAKLPKLTSKLKKKAMEDSIEWLRKNEPELDEIADDTVQAFTNMTGVVVPDKLDKRAKKLKTRDAIVWIRNNNVNLEEVPDTCLHVLEEIVPPSAVSPRVPPSDVWTSGRDVLNSKEVVSIGIEWLRNIEEDVEDVDDMTMKELTRMTGVRMPEKITRESKKKTMDDAIEW